MYKLTDLMLQNLERDLGKFHELFQGGRCQAWQLEELLAKAIRSDFNRSHRVKWKGNGHDMGHDILVDDTYPLQVKSGKIEDGTLVLSGHRLTRFKGNLEKITDFLNASSYSLIAVPYKTHEDENGRKHIYQIFYLDTDMLKLDDHEQWEEVSGKKGGVSYRATNNIGVELQIIPSMSWQVWWKIPISEIHQDKKTRELVI
jgi:hypothetical protein